MGPRRDGGMASAAAAVTAAIVVACAVLAMIHFGRFLAPAASHAGTAGGKRPPTGSGLILRDYQ